MARSTARYVVARGALRTIECAVCSDGSMPAKDFIESLNEQEQRKLATLFNRMADTGKIWDPRKFKQIQDKIYEFKRYQVRIGCFSVANRWRLTHGFIKKQEKWPKSELKRAERIMGEDLERNRDSRGGTGKQ